MATSRMRSNGTAAAAGPRRHVYGVAPFALEARGDERTRPRRRADDGGEPEAVVPRQLERAVLLEGPRASEVGADCALAPLRPELEPSTSASTATCGLVGADLPADDGFRGATGRCCAHYDEGAGSC